MLFCFVILPILLLFGGADIVFKKINPQHKSTNSLSKPIGLTLRVILAILICIFILLIAYTSGMFS